jgi:hypothetical protein
MASGANGGSRHPAKIAENACDDIDAGWEEMPASVGVPVRPPARASAAPTRVTSRPSTPAMPSPVGGVARSAASSFPPVVSVPRPRSSSRALAPERPSDAATLTASATDVVIEVSEDASRGPEAASAEDERVADVRDEELIEAGINAESSGVRIGLTPRPTEIDVPDFRRRQPGTRTFAAFVVAGVVMVGGVAWSQRVSSGARVSASVALPVAEPHVPREAPEPPRSEPVPLPLAPATHERTSALGPALDEITAPSIEKSVAAVAVSVKVVPAGAVVFRAGRRLGAGAVEVSVERNVKQRLTALLDGYMLSNFTLDGSRESVTIVLRRAPKVRADAAEPSDSPSAEPSGDPTPATTPAPTVEPAPESAPSDATKPGVSATEPSPE